MLEVPDAADEQDVAAAARTRVSWLHRLGRPAGDPAVVGARRRGRRGRAAAGSGHAYLLGEASVVLALRERLAARGLPQDQMSPKAYWGRGRANAGHGEPARDSLAPIPAAVSAPEWSQLNGRSFSIGTKLLHNEVIQPWLSSAGKEHFGGIRSGGRGLSCAGKHLDPDAHTRDRQGRPDPPARPRCRRDAGRRARRADRHRARHPAGRARRPGGHDSAVADRRRLLRPRGHHGAVVPHCQWRGRRRGRHHSADQVSGSGTGRAGHHADRAAGAGAIPRPGGHAAPDGRRRGAADRRRARHRPDGARADQHHRAAFLQRGRPGRAGEPGRRRRVPVRVTGRHPDRPPSGRGSR